MNDAFFISWPYRLSIENRLLAVFLVRKLLQGLVGFGFFSRNK